jgi:hypothetical protein
MINPSVALEPGSPQSLKACITFLCLLGVATSCENCEVPCGLTVNSSWKIHKDLDGDQIGHFLTAEWDSVLGHTIKQQVQ